MRSFGPLSRYLFGRILFYSLLLSLLTSLVNGWVAYQDGLARQRAQVQSVITAYQNSLTKAIWEVDYESAHIQLQGLSRFPAILSARIVSAGPKLEYRKKDANQQQITELKVYSLQMPKANQSLGTWEIRLDRELLRQEVWREALRFAWIVSIELFLIAFLIFLLFRRNISLPIQALSEHVQRMDETRLAISAPLPEEKHRHEIHELADGVTRLQHDLLAQFALRDANARELAEHRDQLNQILLQQEHQLDVVVQQMADGSAVISGQGRILFANPAWSAMLNCGSPQAVVGFWPLQWLLKPGWSNIQGRLLQTDTLLGEYLLLNRRDAQSLPVEASFSVLERDMDGVPVRIQIMVRDLSSRLETERVLIAAKEAALMASQTKSAFLANMSHEIRTPLNAVLGFSSLLAETDLDAEQQQYIQNIRHSGTALLTLLNDILDFSKIEAGQLQLENIEFDLRRLLEDTQDIIAAQAQHKGLELLCLVDASVPLQVNGDPSRLRQILLNLLNNAVKFTPKGEIITRARLVQRHGEQARIRIEVADQGIGIAPEVQNQLFQPFHQADVSTTRRFGGTGLGLSICRRLVEAMQGEIGVSSEVGQGAQFWFEIELGLPAKRASSPTPAALHGRQIALLATSITGRHKLQADLLQMGCVVRSYADEASLLTGIAATPPELVLVDLLLGVSLPVHLPARIHAVAGCAQVPVVLSVAQGVQGQGAQADEAGFAAYLSKPIHFEALEQCLAHALQPEQAGEQGGLLTVHKVAELAAKARRHVLLVEDNPMNQKVGVLMLEKLGCRVDLASDGVQAVRAVQLHDYDLVLMDCQMPELDGFDATRQIRALGGRYQQLPIVALTANAFAEDREQCFSAGMNDFMTKPVQIEALQTVLIQWVRPKVQV
ncbi:response regulator [Chitinibacter tainanensis]|uniref:hybrid sensor histidine kinase/response regulator n=1 Tax=Chitinibacter tainanensis TaxID=230667 RepID=UPI0023551513|nr:response regulator [Chitinibacter tainanensis]